MAIEDIIKDKVAEYARRMWQNTVELYSVALPHSPTHYRIQVVRIAYDGFYNHYPIHLHKGASLVSENGKKVDIEVKRGVEVVRATTLEDARKVANALIAILWA